MSKEGAPKSAFSPEELARISRQHEETLKAAEEGKLIPPEEAPKIAEKAFQKPPEPRYPLEPRQETLLLIGELGKDLTHRQRTLLELQFYFGERGVDLYAKTLKGERKEAFDPSDEEDLKTSLNELLETYEDILVPGTEYNAAFEMVQELQSDLAIMKSSEQPSYAVWANFADRIEKFHQPLLLRETDSFPQQQRLAAIENEIKNSLLARIPKMVPKKVPPPQAVIGAGGEGIKELAEQIIAEKGHRLEEVPIPIAKERGLEWRKELVGLLEQKGKGPEYLETGKIITLQDPHLENLLGSSEVTILLPTENLPIYIQVTNLRQGERPHFASIQKDGAIQTRVDYYLNKPETVEQANQTKAIPPERWERFIEEVIELARDYKKEEQA